MQKKIPRSGAFSERLNRWAIRLGFPVLAWIAPRAPRWFLFLHARWIIAVVFFFHSRPKRAIERNLARVLSAAAGFGGGASRYERDAASSRLLLGRPLPLSAAAAGPPARAHRRRRRARARSVARADRRRRADPADDRASGKLGARRGDARPGRGAARHHLRTRRVRAGGAVSQSHAHDVERERDSASRRRSFRQPRGPEGLRRGPGRRRSRETATFATAASSSPSSARAPVFRPAPSTSRG